VAPKKSERSRTGYVFQIPLDIRTASAAKQGQVRKGISSNLHLFAVVFKAPKQRDCLSFFSGERESTCLSNIHLTSRKKGKKRSKF